VDATRGRPPHRLPRGAARPARVDLSEDERVHRWGWRVVGFVAVVALLFAGAIVAGGAGTFSSATARLGRDLQDPAKRLAAVTELADQVAASFAGEHPTLPGARGEQTCPGTYAARASTLIGSLSPPEATEAMQTALQRLRNTGWTVDQRQLQAPSPALTARNRRGIEVTVIEQPGDELATIQVSVTAPCATAPRTGGVPPSPSSSAPEP
jgi:hypothetical protein